MKHSIKIILLIALWLTAVYTVFAQQNITVFQQQVTIEKPLVKKEFATSYPIAINASHLRNCVARGVTSADLSEIYSAVKSSINSNELPSGDPVFGAFFTTEYDDDTLNIIQEKTHGFCFGFHADLTLTLYYFESNGMRRQV